MSSPNEDKPFVGYISESAARFGFGSGSPVGRDVKRTPRGAWNVPAQVIPMRPGEPPIGTRVTALTSGSGVVASNAVVDRDVRWVLVDFGDFGVQQRKVSDLWWEGRETPRKTYKVFLEGSDKDVARLKDIMKSHGLEVRVEEEDS